MTEISELFFAKRKKQFTYFLFLFKSTHCLTQFITSVLLLNSLPRAFIPFETRMYGKKKKKINMVNFAISTQSLGPKDSNTHLKLFSKTAMIPTVIGKLIN